MPTKSQDIILTRTIFASPAQVYTAFTRAEGWCMWCCEKAEVKTRIGGKLHIYTDGYNAYGEFTFLEENKAVAFTWNGDKEPPTQIYVGIDPQADHTLLTFKVTAEDPEGWIGPEGSWTSFPEFLEQIWGHALDNLKSVLEEKAGMDPVSGNAR